MGHVAAGAPTAHTTAPCSGQLHAGARPPHCSPHAAWKTPCRPQGRAPCDAHANRRGPCRLPSTVITRCQRPGADGQRSSQQQQQQQSPDCMDSIGSSSLQSEQQLYDADMWASKPAWCQPSTILLTGVLAVGFTNMVSGHSVLLTALVAAPVAVWWWLFLLVVPSGYTEQVKEHNAAVMEARERAGAQTK